MRSYIQLFALLFLGLLFTTVFITSPVAAYLTGAEVAVWTTINRVYNHGQH